MSLFRSNKSPESVGGSIAYFGLQDWWLSEFTAEERQQIQSHHQPLGDAENSLTSGVITATNQSSVGLLSSLASWLSKPDTRPIAHRVLRKAFELSDDAPILDVHFLFQQAILVYYKDRANPICLQAAIDACWTSPEIVGAQLRV